MGKEGSLDGKPLGTKREKISRVVESEKKK